LCGVHLTKLLLDGQFPRANASQRDRVHVPRGGSPPRWYSQHSVRSCERCNEETRDGNSMLEHRRS
jgi:hypothetical protein